MIFPSAWTDDQTCAKVVPGYESTTATDRRQYCTPVPRKDSRRLHLLQVLVYGTLFAHVFHSAACTVGRSVLCRPIERGDDGKCSEKTKLEKSDQASKNAKQSGTHLQPMHALVGAACNQVGREPKIIVWDTATMQTIKVLRGFHQRAVTLLVRGGPRAHMGVAILACLTYLVDHWQRNLDSG